MPGKREKICGRPAEDGGEGAEVVGLEIMSGGLLSVDDVHGGFRGILGHGGRNGQEEDREQKNCRWRSEGDAPCSACLHSETPYLYTIHTSVGLLSNAQGRRHDTTKWLKTVLL